VRADAIVIGVAIEDAAATDAALAGTLAEVCPVDIFAAGDAGVAIVEENLDECILCGMCVRASDGAVTVHKLYSDETLDVA
jgi:NAD-dependent dihydropyrimidine dehydrogenase PreA subunit